MDDQIASPCRPPHGWPVTCPGSGNCTGIPCCVVPGASPHCDLLLCSCGNTNTKVYSNPSGSGTARCLGPSLGNGPAFCLISLGDNYSRGPEGLQGKGRCSDVNKLIADSSCEQEALTSYILGKALGKARPERSLHTQFLCYREGV